ncbi:MAG TPA: PHP domain-containing protein [Gemmataceae bacterium]|nr:PHP domain-containing protein [Gemmataceae bacterium]
MPAGQPFTALCRAAARTRSHGRADLHLHTAHSDGRYTPAQVVELARRSGLAAVALTDHDTLAGVPEAQAAAAGTGVEVVPGVEISSEWRGAELHLLAYFVRVEDGPLQEALGWLRACRAERFWEMARRLRGCGVSLDEGELRAQAAAGAVGRRNLAEALVRAGRAGTVAEAFRRWLGDRGQAAVPKERLPAAKALALVRGAGGVAAWAHPSYDCTRAALAELRGLGLGAVEAEYPGTRESRRKELRAWAAELGLAVSGGSDCHGPEPAGRAVGACSITMNELEALRRAR